MSQLPSSLDGLSHTTPVQPEGLRGGAVSPELRERAGTDEARATDPIAGGLSAPQPQAPPAAAAGTFAGVSVRPAGSRYGDADLCPGGSMQGGMVMDAAALERMMGPCGRGGASAADQFSRYDPMFPGQPRPGLPPPPQQQQPWGPSYGPGPGRAFPGEPDSDNFMPPQGGPFQPFGGPGGGQFGPGGGGFGPGPGPSGFC